LSQSTENVVDGIKHSLSIETLSYLGVKRNVLNSVKVISKKPECNKAK
jgi:hypothetical protein